jgi:hypothetical protein
MVLSKKVTGEASAVSSSQIPEEGSYSTCTQIPKKDVTVGIRHIPASVPLMAAAGLCLKELVKYPPQFKIGFLSNNPPVYDLLPKAREMLEKNGEKGVGRQRILEE